MRDNELTITAIQKRRFHTPFNVVGGGDGTERAGDVVKAHVLMVCPRLFDRRTAHDRSAGGIAGNARPAISYRLSVPAPPLGCLSSRLVELPELRLPEWVTVTMR